MRFAFPLAAAVAALVIANWYIAPGVDLAGMARGVAGPGTWPKAMLYCVAGCSGAVFIRNVFFLEPEKADAPQFDDAKLLPGIALLVAYGIGFTEIGMAWSTLLFLAGWLVLSGFRRPLSVVLVSVLGTAGVLYLFVKLCMMPLERGKGIFETATILLYRMLGIY
jgi:putative tricarboxylic transport membrane protein